MANTKLPARLLDTSAVPALNVTGDLTVDTTTLKVDSSNNRVGIGTSSPQGNLHVEGAAGASGGGIIYVTDADNGSTASDALHISKSGDTAFVYNRESSGDLQLGAGNTAGHVVIKSSGNVGIGTTSPQQLLNLAGGGLQITGYISTPSSGQTGVLIDYASDGARFWSRGTSSARGTFSFIQLENDGQNQQTAMSIDTSGNVQVGASSVANCLIGNDGDLINIKSKKDGTDAIPLTFMTQASGGALAERMRIDGSGNVAIGSTNNGVGGTIDLSVGSTSSSGGITLWSPTNGTHSLGFGDGTSGTDRYRGYVEYAHDGDSMRFATAAAERMRIDSGGHLLVGTTSEYSGTSGNITAPLQIDIGANDTNSKYVFVNRSASTGVIGGFKAGVTGFSTMGRVELKADNVVGGAQSSSFHVYTTLNATEAQKMQIDSNGHVYFTSLYGSAADQNDVRYNASSGLLFYNTSSRRYKENIKDMPDGVLDKIKQARVVTFDEKGTDVSSYGLIAEELDELIPELVTKKEIDGELVPDSIVYSKIGVWVLKAIQEQQTQIEAMQLEIDNLKKS